MAEDDRRRIDKWLWFARLTKTRTTAQKLVVAGHVRVNRDKIDNASRAVRIGDVLTIALDSGVRVLRIQALGERRGPAAEARLLYDDLTPPAAEGGRQQGPRRAFAALTEAGFAADEEFPNSDDQVGKSVRWASSSEAPDPCERPSNELRNRRS